MLLFKSGQLSTSQICGLIIVPYKKGDHLDLKNFHPNSLLNVDIEIATMAIFGRLLGVWHSLPYCIGELNTHLRPYEYVACADISLTLLSLDQEKAFDHVNWGFLQCILIKFSFVDSCGSWISFLYWHQVRCRHQWLDVVIF